MNDMNQKRRVLIFSLVYYPNFIGGAEVAIKEITDRLLDIDFDMVTLRLDSNLPKVEKIGNVTIYRVGWTLDNKASPDSLPKSLHLNKYAMLFTAWWQSVKLQRKKHYDVIWSMMATYNSFAALFFKFTFPKVKFLLTLQEGDPIPFIKRRARPLWPLFKMIFTKADTIQAISKYLADFGIEMGAKCPVVVVPNAVDITLFTKEYPSAEIEEIKNKLGIKDGDVLLITTSRLVSKNAVEDIVKSMPLLPEHIKLVIAGRGYMEDSIKKLAVTLGVDSRINFIGWLSHAEMPKYLKASHIFIRTPISEGFGNSFVEAMASGLPCIATPVGGILDFITDTKTGLLVPVRDHKAISDAVLRLVSDSDLVLNIKRNALEMVKSKYDWEIIAKDMRRIFNNI